MYTKLITPISGKQINKSLPGVKVILYRDLKKYKKLPKLPIVILYEIRDGFGHWVTLLRSGKNKEIEHFDSYGYAPDKEMDFVPEKFKNEVYKNNKYLLRLLYKSKEPINYNQYNLQAEPPISTCGRWVIVRNMFPELDIDQFKDMIYKTSKDLDLYPDEIVSKIV